jgi:sec-independent protein translocase protein TatA
MGTFSIWHWLVVLAVILLLFGGSKLRNLGGDLGASIKGFRNSMRDGEAEAAAEQSHPAPQQPSEEIDAKIKALMDEKARLQPQPQQGSGRVIEGEAGKSEHKA